MKNPVIKTLLLAISLSFSTQIIAETFTWTGAANDNKWRTEGNWSVGGVQATRAPGAVPNNDGTDIAVLDSSSTPTTISADFLAFDDISGDGSILLDQVRVEAPGFIIENNVDAFVDPLGGNNLTAGFDFLGAGIVGNEALTLKNLDTGQFSGDVAFLGSSKAGATILENEGRSVLFADNATADNATITTSGRAITNFLNKARAGTATLITTGAFDLTGNSPPRVARVQFGNNASAEEATFTNSNLGQLSFFNTSTAAKSIITNDEAGSTFFYNETSAGDSVITNNTGGTTQFSNAATAANATFYNQINSNVFFNDDASAQNAEFDNKGVIEFIGNSKAGSSVINNLNNNDDDIPTLVNFFEDSSAENATITNDAGAGAQFLDRATAADAKFNNKIGGSIFFANDADAANAHFENRGIINFRDNSQAEFATIICDAGTSAIDLINRNTPLKIGSLSGFGLVRVFGQDFINQVDVKSDATLSLGHLNQNETFSGGFYDNQGGQGSVLTLIKEGTGTLIVNNTQNNYSGDTIINNGTLQWDGGNLSVSDFFVNAGGKLTGALDLVNSATILGTLTNDGVVAPGNPTRPFGTLFAENYASSSTGTLLFTLSETENSVFKTGMADFSNTTSQLVFRPGRYDGTQKYDIVVSDYPLPAPFGSELSPPRLEAVYDYDTDNKLVTVTVSELPFVEIAKNLKTNIGSDGASLCGALDTLISGNITSELNTLVGQINLFSEDQIKRLFDEVGTDSLNTLSSASLDVVGSISALFAEDIGSGLAVTALPFTRTSYRANSLSAAHRDQRQHRAFKAPQRTASSFQEMALDLKAYHGAGSRDYGRAMISDYPGMGHLWVQGFGNRSNVDRTENDFGFSSTSGGMMAGFDYQVSDDLRLGAGGGFTIGNIAVHDQLAHTKIRTPFASLWGNYVMGHFDIDAGVTYLSNSYEHKRNLSLLGRSAKADFGGYVIAPHMKMSYHFFDDPDLHFKPFVAVDYFHAHDKKYTETGAGLFNLDVNARTSGLIQSTAGLAVDRHIKYCSGVLTPGFEISYRNRSFIRRAETKANFVNTNATFISTNRRKSQHFVGLKGEVGYAWHDGSKIKIGYHGNYAEKYNSHSALITVGQSW